MREILTDGVDRKNSLDFIDEFNSYVILSSNVKYCKLLTDTIDNAEKIKFAVIHRQRKIRKKTIDMETDQFLISHNENDFRLYKYKTIIYNGLSIYIESEEYIYPPDWRKKTDISYVNNLLSKSFNAGNNIKKYLSEKGKYKFLIFTIKQPNGKRVNIGIQLTEYTFDIEKMIFQDNATFSFLSINSMNPKQLCIRGGGAAELNLKKVLVIGCGSIGGYLIEQIAKSGINNIEVIDHDILKEENIYRHILGMEYVDRYKSEAICEYIKRNIPHINITGLQTTIEDALEDESIDLNNYNLIISAVGNHNVNRWLNEYVHKHDIRSTVMYIWNEVLDIGNHILITNNSYPGCYECLFKLDDNDEIYDRSSYCEKGQNFTLQFQGCGSEYLPYSSTHSLRIVTYAIDYIKKIINEELRNNILFSLKGTDQYFNEKGYLTSNRFKKQDSTVKIVKGEEFKEDGCKFCKNIE